ncbi:ino80p [Saccharomyces arboricola H-6]|uniref:Chromatin-remodeling ATPase INO80 n=1 Tax=Saccharomyces arboricola (strain H-6 / AS 2.3317 / CBS 10644) TaxID=1160507 RepID=J8Q2D6_SACAR|nr:ino80p [Saccharomyces arboricola H-6]
MSLAVLLNKEDKDISDFSKTITDKSAKNKGSETVADGSSDEVLDKKQTYLRQLNSEFERIKRRDSIEQLYQDWKFINLQEFELISEWNQQSKDWQFDGSNDSHDLHFKKLYRDMSAINKEWTEYQAFRNTNLSDIINEKDADEDEDEDEDEMEDGEEAMEEEDGGNSKHANGKTVRGNGAQKSKKKDSMAAIGKVIKNEKDNSDAVVAIDGDENEGGGDKNNNDNDDNENENENGEEEDNDDEDENDDDDEEEDEMEDLDEEDFAAFEEQDDNDDEDFNPDIEKRRKRSSSSSSSTKLSMNSLSLITSKKINKNITINSDRPKIVRELIKMCNKNKHQKIKKRRFTNCIVTDYNPIDSKLNIKITLKQYHVKRLKKLINDAKREREREEALKNNVDLDGNELDNDEDGPESHKRRKLNNNNASATDDPNKRKFNTRHGLPTYGMKMNAKEARAIQRHYDNTYTTIWKDMARKDSTKMSRLVQQMQSIRSTNFRKTSSLCAREAKKWQSKNFKQIKDFQTRARRGIREMSNFWKKNEREERDLKKKIEKEAMEQAKKEEEEKESKRQAKKLNFLLTQTELYSHFIGRKIKTNELEGGSGSNNDFQSHKNIDISALAPNKNDFHSIDFDNENDEQLRQRAAENASNALAETRAKAKQFDDHANTHGEDDEEDELNFQNPTSLGEITIEQPKILACTLKEYQLKGLNWLANLYDQGINGILADEMGLGKTVQSISVLAHLAENHNIWGPFLVVTPASTLHNWVNEISKFLPDFKILPYWGNANDRKVLRKFWDRKNLRYNKNAPFHVMVTSYQMVVTDANYLQKMKWQYMILDEAQAIKSSQSSRWKNLLSFHCRNRLLLTGTPIQNSMQELWALLHFIMPSLFDSHDEFNEWFSKDIESHAEANTKLNQQQLRRLHMILKPFMLRRVKKNVQSELGDKIEIDVLCDLTQRQSKLYQVLKSQISTNYDAIENAATNDSTSNSSSNTGSDQNLINAVMQFRKVCNHPDLFERADVDSPFSFTTFGKTTSMLTASVANNNSSVVNNSNMNLSSMSSSNISNGKFTDLIYSSRNPIKYYLPRLIYDDLILPNYNNNVDIAQKLKNVKFNIFNTSINYELCLFLAKLTGETSLNEFFRVSNTSLLKRTIEHTIGPQNANSLIFKNKTQELLQITKNTSSKGVLASLLNIKELAYENDYLNNIQRGYHPNVSAPPITIEVLGSSHISNSLNHELFDPVVTQALSDIPAITQYNMHVNKKIPVEKFPKTGLFPEPLNKNFSSNISMPSMDRFITESAKLRKLDELLVKLKAEGHRVLIYFQMTKMMDLMEEYLTYRQYNHIRLDGSSKLEDRRDLVHDWQTNPEIFVFLLSTRAGGLGINLTAADTVIFYDSDWNPTIDSQAMDRAHRLGQTRQVTVYRLLVRGTIEERMRDRAKQKEQVQQVVMEGKTQEKNIKTIAAGENDSEITPESGKNMIQDEVKVTASALA